MFDTKSVSLEADYVCYTVEFTRIVVIHLLSQAETPRTAHEELV